MTYALSWQSDGEGLALSYRGEILVYVIPAGELLPGPQVRREPILEFDTEVRKRRGCRFRTSCRNLRGGVRGRWRIQRIDGEVSDFGNICQIKDAAREIAIDILLRRFRKGDWSHRPCVSKAGSRNRTGEDKRRRRRPAA
jgi:hypothetical protein